MAVLSPSPPLLLRSEDDAVLGWREWRRAQGKSTGGSKGERDVAKFIFEITWATMADFMEYDKRPPVFYCSLSLLIVR
jgi:hypothetical protein